VRLLVICVIYLTEKVLLLLQDQLGAVVCYSGQSDS
jgi:hypothetical protein